MLFPLPHPRCLTPCYVRATFSGMASNANDSFTPDPARTAARSSGLKLFVPSVERTRDEVVGFSGGLTPDDARLDAILTGVGLDLMLTAKDENVKASVLHDFLTTRGHFAKAQARGLVAAGAGLTALTAKPDVFAKLLGGLAELGFVSASAAQDVSTELRSVAHDGTNDDGGLGDDTAPSVQVEPIVEPLMALLPHDAPATVKDEMKETVAETQKRLGVSTKPAAPAEEPAP